MTNNYLQPVSNKKPLEKKKMSIREQKCYTIEPTPPQIDHVTIFVTTNRAGERERARRAEVTIFVTTDMTEEGAWATLVNGASCDNFCHNAPRPMSA
jgi:hypothetical protein